MSREAEGARKRSQRVRVVVDKKEVSFARQAWVLCEALIRSRGQRRRRTLGFGCRFARRSGDAGLALRQIDSKRGAAAFVARDGNAAVMIADYRLNNGKSQPSPLQFRRVIRREEPRAFFRGQSISGNGSVRNNSGVMVGLPTSLNCGSNRRTAFRMASFTFTRTNCGAGIFEKSLKRLTMVLRLASSAFSVAVDS